MYVIHWTKGFRIKAFLMYIIYHPNMEWIFSLFGVVVFFTQWVIQDKRMFTAPKIFSLPSEQKIFKSSGIESNVPVHIGRNDQPPP